MSLAVIFRPKAFGQRSSFLFFYAIARDAAVRKGRRTDEVEMQILELKKGVNFIEEETWTQISNHGKNSEVIAQMLRKNALAVYKPDAEDVVGSTSDFTDLSVVADILQATDDAEWIQRSIARDKRKEVFKLGSDRIKEIQEDKADRRQQGAMSLDLV